MWSGKSWIRMLVCLSLLETVRAPAQEKPPSAHHPDYRKCKKCAPALARAMAYLKANFENPKTPRVIGSMTGGYMMSGFAFLMDGEGSSKELEKCVKHCCSAIKDQGYNRNWYLGMCLFFLAEYSLKMGLTPEVEKALREGLRLAEEQQERTGGWCHHLRMWTEDGYNKKGGGQDLGMITVMCYGAFLEMKALGLAPGPVAERAQKNLESISDGTGIRYGTDNNVGDAAMARAAYVLLALQATGNATHPFSAKFSKGLEQRYAKVEEEIHGYAPFHYFSVAAAMHRQGPDAYRKFTEAYLDRLLATQTPEGVVPLRKEDDVASTAVFASILMMQKDRIFFPRSSRLDRPSPRSNKEEFRLASEALAREEYSRAYQHLENVVPDRDSEELVPEARERMRKIADLSWSRLKDAEALEQSGASTDALKAYQSVEKAFSGLPASAEAKIRIQALRSAPPPGKS